VGKLGFGMHRVTGFVLGRQKVFGCVPSPGLLIPLFTRFELLPHPGEFELELMTSDPVGEEILDQLPDLEFYGSQFARTKIVVIEDQQVNQSDTASPVLTSCAALPS
jgi:hypothetical protein